mmetsp:Transcript_10752/g.25679  ORF Transcript_10752/g.25679 Transcript_10752/m.25679 type:complete len:211 (-) Transcript_10752:14-646(-)
MLSAVDSCARVRPASSWVLKSASGHLRIQAIKLTAADVSLLVSSITCLPEILFAPKRAHSTSTMYSRRRPLQPGATHSFGSAHLSSRSYASETLAKCFTSSFTHPGVVLKAAMWARAWKADSKTANDPSTEASGGPLPLMSTSMCCNSCDKAPVLQSTSCTTASHSATKSTATSSAMLFSAARNGNWARLLATLSTEAIAASRFTPGTEP